MENAKTNLVDAVPLSLKNLLLSHLTIVFFSFLTRYAYDLDQEASAQTDEKKIKLPPGWPSKGQLELKELSYRYRPSTPLVLNNISVKIEAGSKVGVVGRTGAGKTSLFSAILRLAEIEAGEVLVDEVDVSQIGLGDLRSAIAVIPQDPVLFQGTLRFLAPCARRKLI